MAKIESGEQKGKWRKKVRQKKGKAPKNNCYV